ncbi:MAG: glycoside hydrolase family 57, partial [Epsilonproteobacteria bacterium]
MWILSLNKLFYKIYHGNLAFSAIEEETLPEVIDKTYFPLLELIEKDNLKVGLELSAYSLEKVQELRPNWIAKFKELHSKGLIELIGSGYMQLIGPLVPYEININNQKIGLEIYNNILGIVPTIAYINEQVFSKSMVDIYVEAGYKAIS